MVKIGFTYRQKNYLTARISYRASAHRLHEVLLYDRKFIIISYHIEKGAADCFAAPVLHFYTYFLQICFVLNSYISICLTIYDIFSARSVGNHSDWESNLFLNKLYVFTAVLRKIFVFFDSADIAFPSR